MYGVNVVSAISSHWLAMLQKLKCAIRIKISNRIYERTGVKHVAKKKKGGGRKDRFFNV